jgi:hypothetical protein
MKILFFLYSFISIQNNYFKKNKIEKINNKKDKNDDDNNSNSGNDMRFIENNDKESELQINQIKKYIDKKKLLDNLMNNNINILSKLTLIDEYKELNYLSNITKGGLFKDWDNE